MNPWSGIVLEDVTATGNLKQLYPSYCPDGAARGAGRTPGVAIREPTGGTLLNVQVMTDGTNGGTIELWDVNGVDGGIEVSGAGNTTITDTQLDTLAAAGRAKLIWRQNVVADGTTPPMATPRTFLHGLAARFIASGGQVELNLVVDGGYRLLD